MYRLTLALFRIILASLAVGVGLSYFNISAEQFFAEFGMSSQSAVEVLRRAFVWALPHIALGAVVIIPVWFIISLFRPSRD